MHVLELKDKIPGVLAYARLVSIRNGHTKKSEQDITNLKIRRSLGTKSKE